MIRVWSAEALENVNAVRAGIAAAAQGCELLGGLVPGVGDWHGVAHGAYEAEAERLRGRIAAAAAALDEAQHRLEAVPGLWQ